MIDVVREIPREMRKPMRASPLGVAQGLGASVVRGSRPTEPFGIFGSANIRQWVRGDKNVTLTSSRVSTWGDIGADVLNYTQGTVGKRPGQVADPDLNSLPVVLFDGVDDGLASSLILPQASTSPTTIILVVKFLSNASIKVLLHSNQPGDDPTPEKYLQLYTPPSPPTPGSAISAGNGADQVFAGPQMNVWTRVVVGFSGGTLTDPVRVGPTYRSSNGAGDNPANGIGRKISLYTGAECDCAIWELMYVKGIPSERQLDDYDRYLIRTTNGTAL